MRSPPTLSVRGATERYVLTPDSPLTVGRARDCEIFLDDHAVSRRHCTIEARGEEVVVTDLHSINGTYVNDRLVQTASLGPGDTIRVGSTLIDVSPLTAPSDGLAAMLTSGGDELESVIRRRFEPAQFEWLTDVSRALDPGAAGAGLLQRAQRHLSVLHRVSEVFAGARDVSGLADSALGAILDVAAGDRAAFVLRRPDPPGGVAMAAVKGRLTGPDPFTVSSTIVADVLDKGVSTFAYDAVNDARFRAGASVIGQRVRSVMCVPLRTADAILGALYVDSLSAPGRFSEAELELLAAIGNQAGVALHRVRLMGEIERLLLDSIRAITATIDAKDGYTHRHSERVAALAGRIAAAIGLKDEEQQTVKFAGLLHDLGKIAVPDSILNKPGPLTPAEFDEMKKHPVLGVQILANIQSSSVAAVLPGVQYHHERWDGTGYPEGLRGETIPMLGRLLSVADYIDAITSSRSYRVGLTIDKAVALIEQGAGTHFDPGIALTVVELHRRGDLLPPDWDQPVTVRTPDEAEPRGG